jgi:hypothetical protein
MTVATDELIKKARIGRNQQATFREELFDFLDLDCWKEMSVKDKADILEGTAQMMRGEVAKDERLKREELYKQHADCNSQGDKP